MSRRCGIALVLCFCAVAAAAPPPRASVALRPHAEVAGESVLLGEVAILSSTDLGLIRQLVNLPVGRAPHLGQAAIVRQPALAAWIQGQTGLAPGQLDWPGAVESRVVRPSRRLAGDRIGGEALRAMQAQLSGQGFASGGLRVASRPRDLEVPEGTVRLQARPRAYPPLHGRFLVWMDVWVGERLWRTLPVTLEGLPLQRAAAAVTARSVDAPRLQALAMRELVPVQEVPLAVARGDRASMRTVSGAVILESQVEVLQDGRRGDKVRVRQQGATAILFARVVGAGQLELAP